MQDAEKAEASGTAPPPSYAASGSGVVASPIQTSPSQASPIKGKSAARGRLGFPGGYFVIRSVATKKVLDVARGEGEDGTEVILWEEKETSLVEVMRNPEADNQIFFLDHSGNLCSKVNGLPVDVEDNKLVVRRHRPVTYPFPNSYSHPLPHFSFDMSTGFIRVNFGCDPSYPAPSSYPSNAWTERDYLLTSVPARRNKSFLETTSEFFTNTASKVNFNAFGGPGASSSAAQLREGEFDLREDEVLEEERALDDEIDDSPSRRREVVMLNLPLGWAEKERLSPGLERRQWEVLPVLASRNITQVGRRSASSDR